MGGVGGLGVADPQRLVVVARPAAGQARPGPVRHTPAGHVPAHGTRSPIVDFPDFANFPDFWVSGIFQPPNIGGFSELSDFSGHLDFVRFSAARF